MTALKYMCSFLHRNNLHRYSRTKALSINRAAVRCCGYSYTARGLLLMPAPTYFLAVCVTPYTHGLLMRGLNHLPCVPSIFSRKILLKMEFS